MLRLKIALKLAKYYKSDGEASGGLKNRKYSLLNMKIWLGRVKTRPFSDLLRPKKPKIWLEMAWKWLKLYLGCIWKLKKVEIWPLWVQNLTKKVKILDEIAKNESIFSLKMVLKGKNIALRWSKTALGCVPTYAEGFESLKRSKYDLSGSKIWQRKWKFWTKLQKTRVFLHLKWSKMT